MTKPSIPTALTNAPVSPNGTANPTTVNPKPSRTSDKHSRVEDFIDAKPDVVLITEIEETLRTTEGDKEVDAATLLYVGKFKSQFTKLSDLYGTLDAKAINSQTRILNHVIVCLRASLRLRKRLMQPDKPVRDKKKGRS